MGCRVAVAIAFGLLACGGAPTDAEYRADVGTEMHDALTFDLHSVTVAAQQLCDSAPTPERRGWDAVEDAVAITAMKNSWIRARDAYEHVEGAIAPLFPDLDFALDSRYEAYLARSGPDDNAFDAEGVVGLDAIERIVWADVTPQATIDYEKTLPGYAPARFPATAQEAIAFKNQLCQKLASDASALEAAWSTQTLDVGAAYGGLVDLVAEQQTELASGQTGAEESRYCQRTMDDLRANVEGVQAIYGIFRPWIASKDGGADADEKIEAGFDAVQTLYANVPGDALPDAASSDYSALLAAVSSNVDPSRDGTIAFEMNRARTLVGF